VNDDLEIEMKGMSEKKKKVEDSTEKTLIANGADAKWT
jgi:hypothetical protein